MWVIEFVPSFIRIIFRLINFGRHMMWKHSWVFWQFPHMWCTSGCSTKMAISISEAYDRFVGRRVWPEKHSIVEQSIFVLYWLNSKILNTSITLVQHEYNHYTTRTRFHGALIIWCEVGHPGVLLLISPIPPKSVARFRFLPVHGLMLVTHIQVVLNKL